MLRRRFDGMFFYMLYFQTPGVAEAELEADVRASLRRIYYSISGDAPPRSGFLPIAQTTGFLETLAEPPAAFSAWFTEEDLAFYVNEFTRTGFRGGLNWYRNFDRTWERTSALAGAKVTQPALFIAGERDPVIAFGASQVERMKTVVPDLRGTLILPGCGHWTQQERPREVNDALLEFLRSARATR
jgi:pimeloyl-ACP methyl ester carboxylesterase